MHRGVQLQTYADQSHNLPVLKTEEYKLDPVSGLQLSDAEKRRIQAHFCMMICGKPGSGKTTLVQKLIEDEKLYKDKFDRILVVSPSIGKMGFHVPQEFATGEFDLEWIFDHIHKLNLKQEQLLMDQLRSEDAQTVIDSIQNKQKIQQLLEEAIQTQRILDLPHLQRLLMTFNTRFVRLGQSMGPIIGGHYNHNNIPKPKGNVDFSMVPSLFLDRQHVQDHVLPAGDSLLRKQMLQGIITKKQMVNMRTDKVNEIAEYANQVQTLYQTLVLDESIMQQTHLNVLLVLDDVAGDIKQCEFDPSLIKLFFNRRHVLANGTLSIIVITQKFTAIPQKIRTTSSWLILFQLNPIETETVWRDAVVLTQQQWKQILDNVFNTDKGGGRLGGSLLSGHDRRYDNLGIWTEYPDVFFKNFQLMQ